MRTLLYRINIMQTNLYIQLFILVIMLLSVNAHAGLVKIEGETPEEICRVSLPKHYQDAVEDEDELRLAIADNLSKLKKFS